MEWHSWCSDNTFNQALTEGIYVLHLVLSLWVLQQTKINRINVLFRATFLFYSNNFLINKITCFAGMNAFASKMSQCTWLWIPEFTNWNDFDHGTNKCMTYVWECEWECLYPPMFQITIVTMLAPVPGRTSRDILSQVWVLHSNENITQHLSTQIRNTLRNRNLHLSASCYNVWKLISLTTHTHTIYLETAADCVFSNSLSTVVLSVFIKLWFSVFHLTSNIIFLLLWNIFHRPVSITGGCLISSPHRSSFLLMDTKLETRKSTSSAAVLEEKY